MPSVMRMKKYRKFASIVLVIGIALLFYKNIQNYTTAPSIKMLQGLALGDLEAPHVLWYINVGMLYDPKLPQFSSKEVEGALRKASERINATLLQEIELRFIVDQAMDAFFLISETYIPPKKQDSKAWSTEADGDSLYSEAWGASIDTPYDFAQLSASLAQNCKLHCGLRAKKLAQEWRLSQGLRVQGAPLEQGHDLHAYSIWEQYLQHQVRYDLLLSNAFIYIPEWKQVFESPSKEIPKYVRRKSGNLAWGLTETKMRMAMEGHALHVNYSLWSKQKAYAKLSLGQLEQTLYKGLLSLVLPVSIAKVQEAEFLKHLERELARPNSTWHKYWKQRFAYLQAIAVLRSRKSRPYKEKILCTQLYNGETLKTGSNLQSLARSLRLSIEPRRKERMYSIDKKLRQYCNLPLSSIP